MVNEWTIDDLPDHDVIRYVDDMHGNGMRSRVIDLALDTVVGHLNANHPKPAREVTRDDLPDFGAMGSVMAHWKVSYGAVSGVLEAVVEHLNANGGLPTDDRWRRAHEIVEQERDQARESLREACKVAQSYKVDAHHATKRAESAERERDAAEYAEARTAPTVSREEVISALTVGIRGTTDGDLIDQEASIPAGECVRLAVYAVCALFGVEAEPADQVEQKAAELYEAAWPNSSPWGSPTIVNPDQYRRMARRVLGQETDQ